MKKINLLAGSLFCALVIPGYASAQERYQQPRPIKISAEITQPWILQLRTAPGTRKIEPVIAPQRPKTASASTTAARHGGLFAALFSGPGTNPQAIQQQKQTQEVRTAQLFPRPDIRPLGGAPSQFRLDTKWLPQTVAYDGPEKPGTIIIDTPSHFLYFIENGGAARRFGVGVGKDGFRWSGTERIARKAEWPGWTPPTQMIEREAQKGHYLPTHMDGGPANPLGARALYLGSTLYRIHGTNAPWTIGKNVSSGCIRMRNEDVTELYGMAKVGTKVVVR